MQTLTNNEYKLFQQLVSLNQKQLLKTMSSFLQKHYESVITTKDYVFAIGDVPVALIAHVDTVFKSPPTDIFYDRQKNVMWSPQGLGADDRAGVFAIIKIIRKGLRPHIILTTDEELGGFGARTLVSAVHQPFADMKYIIQLDRRGTNDCVFYDCENILFTKYIESFGFSEAYGSFSDISIICPKWKIAGVNLSVGYMDEHSFSETFYITPFLATVEKVANMLKDVKNITEPFDYIPCKYSYSSWNSLNSNVDCWGFDEIKCMKCNQYFSDYEMFPVKTLDGKTKFCCPDCLVEIAQWCDRCGEAFEVKPGSNEHFCEDCRGNSNAKH